MIRSRPYLLLLGVLAAACSTTHPTELADDDPQASEQNSGESGLQPPQQVAPLGTAQQAPSIAPAQLGASADAGTVFVADGGSVPSRDAGTAPTTFDGTQACVVLGSETYASPERLSWRETWDATTRVHTRYTTAAPDSGIELAWRYDAQGRAISYIGVRNAFQQDYQLDEHGNEKDFRLSYPPRPDLFVPFTGDPWMGWSYTNEYSASGVLQASTATPYGAGNGSATVVRYDFTQDEQGRCVRIESKGGWADTIETRSYDAADRLSTLHVESSRSAAFNFQCLGASTSHEYDSSGRIVRKVKRCDGGQGAPMIWLETRAYGSDGSVTIESYNFDTDLGSEVTIDGKMMFASHQTVKRSPGCAAVDRAILRVDTACHAL